MQSIELRDIPIQALHDQTPRDQPLLIKPLLTRAFRARVMLWSVLMAAWLGASSAAAQTCPSPRFVPIHLETSGTCFAPIEDVSQLPGSLSLQLVEPPLHGVAEVINGQICYAPGGDFWSLRRDRLAFSYFIDSQIQTGFAQLFADLPTTMTLSDGFEDSLTSCGWTEHDPADKLGLSAAAAISGNQGLRISAGDSRPAFLTLAAEGEDQSGYRWPPACRFDLSHGTTDDCFEIGISGAIATQRFSGTAVIFSADSADQGSEEALQLRLVGRGDDPPWLSARTWDAAGVPHDTPGVELTAHNARVQLGWWHDDGEGAGLFLRVNGLFAGSISGLDRSIESLSAIHIGLKDPEVDVGPFLDLDDLGVGDRDPDSHTGSPSPSFALVENFECSSSGNWSAQGLRPPTVTSSAALGGSFGLAVDLSAIVSSSPRYGFLHHTALQATDSFNLRFKIDSHTVSLANGASVILAGGATTDSPHSDESVRLKLRQFGGQMELRAEQKLGAAWSQLKATDWVPLGVGSHTVALQWRAASDLNAKNGYLRLWIDGSLRAQLLGLDNSLPMESFRLGGIWAPVSGAGTLYIDDVEVWR